MKELLLSALLALQMYTFAKIPPSSSFSLHVEGLKTIDVLTFGKNSQSFVINVDEEDEEILKEWKDKRNAQLRIVDPTGGVTIFCMKGASVKNNTQPTNFEVIYNTMQTLKEEK